MTEPKAIDPQDLRDPRYREAISQGTRGLKDAEDLRGLVLAHPDLAERLTIWPVGYTAAQNWNGYIPPLMTCAEAGRRNDSARRAALIAIVAEAMERDYGPEAAVGWKWRIG